MGNDRLIFMNVFVMCPDKWAQVQAGTHGLIYIINGTVVKAGTHAPMFLPCVA